jgi:acetylglutamate kinase
LRAKKAVFDTGRDMGSVGEVVEVNREFLKMFLDGGYVPVISPIGLSDDGTSLSINADMVAAALAVALGASKLLHLTDVAGILDSPEGELVRQLTAADLTRRMEAGAITGGMKWKAQSILTALRGGVSRVHVLDGRQPHSVIAELFTDRGVGSLVTLE